MIFIYILQIYDKTDIALAYLPGNVTRIKVKAIGDLLLDENQQGALWKQPTGQVVGKNVGQWCFHFYLIFLFTDCLCDPLRL